MIKNNEYAKVLRKLIDLSELKLAYVAKTVGYDISYISKWCCGRILPPRKNAYTINETIAKMLAVECVNKNLYTIFEKSFNLRLKDGASIKSTSQSINKLINTAYDKSKPEYDIVQNVSIKPEVVAGYPDAMIHVIDLINTIIMQSEDEIELLSTQNLCTLIEMQKTDTTAKLYLNQRNVKAKFCVDSEKIVQSPKQHLKYLYQFLDDNINAQISIYKKNRIASGNLLVIKNHVALLISIDDAGKFIISYEIWDKKTIHTLYDYICPFFSRENLVLKSNAAPHLMMNGFRTRFYAAAEFYFYTTFGFEYLLPADIVASIGNKAVKHYSDVTMEDYIRRLQITWEERFLNGKITFILSKSAIIQYVENGELYYIDIPFTLTVDQRRRHARNIVKCLRNNNNIRFVVYDDEHVSHFESKDNSSVYFNHAHAFVKKNGYVMENPDDDLCTQILDRQILGCLSGLFESFIHSSRCKIYGPDEIEEIIDKYETMFLRMLEIV